MEDGGQGKRPRVMGELAPQAHRHRPGVEPGRQGQVLYLQVQGGEPGELPALESVLQGEVDAAHLQLLHGERGLKRGGRNGRPSNGTGPAAVFWAEA